jgi:hypothetical protein
MSEMQQNLIRVSRHNTTIDLSSLLLLAKSFERFIRTEMMARSTSAPIAF